MHPLEQKIGSSKSNHACCLTYKQVKQNNTYTSHVKLQWTLSISTNIYLEHLSISNYFTGPLNIPTKYTLILSLYLEFLYRKFPSISNQTFAPVATILSQSRMWIYQQLEFSAWFK